MRAVLEKLDLKFNSSLIASGIEGVKLDAPYHIHSELFELALVQRGSGRRVVGENISEFKDFDLVLIAPKLPHSYLSLSDSKKVKTQVLQFSKDLIFSNSVPEFMEFKKFLKSSRGGLMFSKFYAKKVAKLIQKIRDSSDRLLKVLLFYKIMKLLLDDDSKRVISPTLSSENIDGRIQRSVKFISENFRRKIPLSEISRVAAMSEGGFSRLFFLTCGVRPREHIVNLRLAYAAKLLPQSGAPVTDIAFESGFENISNFNRLFKKKFGVSPLKYRKLFK